MAKVNDDLPELNDDDVDPVELDEPGGSDSEEGESKTVWIRGLFMILFAILFGIGQTVLAACAILQFLWMLLGKSRNQAIADFGSSLAKWLAAVARFQTGATDDKPFPWKAWEN